MKLLKGKFAKHMLFAIVAQGLSLLQSSFMTFIVAKILDQTIFAWWQWFLFLSGLTHYVHIGVGEGILLKYGGTPYRELDHRLLSGEYRNYALLQFICAAAICLFGFLRFSWTNEGICVILAGFYLIAYNLTFFLSQVLIASNRTPEYSRAVIFDKGLLFVSSLCLIIGGYRNFVMFSILYCLGQYAELFLCRRSAPEIVSRSSMRFSAATGALLNDASQGFFLSLSTFLANQVTGIGRLCIRLFNGLLDFGALSLSNSLCNFLLIFVRQIGMVIFPFLRENSEEGRRDLYFKLSSLVALITPVAMTGYFPLRWILARWLAKYSSSLVYLSYIMPITLLDSQMSALNTPYLNTMRKERLLLKINGLALLVTTLCTIVSIKAWNSIELVALSISIGMSVKDYVSTIYISRVYRQSGLSIARAILPQILLIACFVVTAVRFTAASFFAYLACYALYCVFYRKEIREMAGLLRRRFSA